MHIWMEAIVPRHNAPTKNVVLLARKILFVQIIYKKNREIIYIGECFDRVLQEFWRLGIRGTH